MEKIREIFRKNSKFILGIVIGLVIAGTGAYAVVLNASDIVYDNTNSGITSTNMQGAINELYNRATTEIEAARNLGRPVYFKSSFTFPTYNYSDVATNVGDTYVKLENQEKKICINLGDGDEFCIGIWDGTDSSYASIKTYLENNCEGASGKSNDYSVYSESNEEGNEYGRCTIRTATLTHPDAYGMQIATSVEDLGFCEVSKLDGEVMCWGQGNTCEYYPGSGTFDC